MNIKKAGKILTIVLFIWLAGYVAFAVNSIAARPQQEEQITDAIVVLTGGNFRVHTGLELFAKGRALHLFISGVNPQVTRREITSLWEGETALPPCCITLGSKSNTTIENAAEVREWVKEKGYTSLRLVTSGYHMPRAMLEFRHALPEVDVIANPVTRKDTGPGEEWFWHITFEEYNKSLYRWLVLLVTPTQPVFEAAS
jgi:uncharacterized SAM-binding protein YcdF (DUF218 family)